MIFASIRYYHDKGILSTTCATCDRYQSLLCTYNVGSSIPKPCMPYQVLTDQF